MSELTIGMAIDQDVIENIVEILNDYNDGFYVDGLSIDEVVSDLKVNSFIYVGMAEGLIQGVFIFTRMKQPGYVNTHICVMNNKYNWHQFFVEQVHPEIAKHATTLYGIIKKEQKGLVRLYKKYGYDLKFDKDINRWIYLQTLH